jgi:hypothetical protein
MVLAGERLTLGASIGVALADGQCSPADLLRNADIAMYTAKRHNKGGYALYEAEMHARASKRLLLRSQLEVALEHDQFKLFFQPPVDGCPAGEPAPAPRAAPGGIEHQDRVSALTLLLATWGIFEVARLTDRRLHADHDSQRSEHQTHLTSQRGRDRGCRGDRRRRALRRRRIRQARRR